jgi:hypothetical protein
MCKESLTDVRKRKRKMMMIIIFFSVGCDYVSELWPPTGQLFMPQEVYEHEEP